MNKEYLSTDIPVSSLTYALKGQRLLEQKGFYNNLYNSQYQ